MLLHAPSPLNICHCDRSTRTWRLRPARSPQLDSNRACGTSACHEWRSCTSQRIHRNIISRARRKKSDAGESFFTFDEQSDADEPPGPADDVQDASQIGRKSGAPEVEALSLMKGSPDTDIEPGVMDEQDESEDGQFWENFFMQAQQRQSQQDPAQSELPSGENLMLPAAQEKKVAPLNIGDENVDFFIQPEHYLEVISSPFRYKTTYGTAVTHKPGEMDVPPQDYENLPMEELTEWTIVLQRELKNRKKWEEEQYLEQYFEIASRQMRDEVNRFAPVQRLATITRHMELQDEAGIMPEHLQRIPPFVRANLVFDREFDWYNGQFDETIMSKRAQQDELDEARVFGNIVVPEEMLAEHPLLGLETKKAKEAAADPLKRFLVGVLPGTEKDSLREEKQQQYLTDLLGEAGEDDA